MHRAARRGGVRCCRGIAHEALHLLAFAGRVPRAHRAAAQGPRDGEGHARPARGRPVRRRLPEAQSGRRGADADRRRRASRSCSRSRSSNISTRSIPQPPLLPRELRARAHARAIAQMVAMDAHPFIVPRVRKYLEEELRLDEPARAKWVRHWLDAGSRAVEEVLAQRSAHGQVLRRRSGRRSRTSASRRI